MRQLRETVIEKRPSIVPVRAWKPKPGTAKSAGRFAASIAPNTILTLPRHSGLMPEASASLQNRLSALFWKLLITVECKAVPYICPEKFRPQIPQICAESLYELFFAKSLQ